MLTQSVTETNNSTVWKLTNVWLQSLHSVHGICFCDRSVRKDLPCFLPFFFSALGNPTSFSNKCFYSSLYIFFIHNTKWHICFTDLCKTLPNSTWHSHRSHNGPTIPDKLRKQTQALGDSIVECNTTHFSWDSLLSHRYGCLVVAWIVS